MNVIQVVLIASLVVAGGISWLVLKKALFIRMFFLLQFVLGIVFVIWPDLTTKIAEIVGVGRGTDLLLYVLVVFVYFSGLCILGKFRQLEHQQTLLVRELAVLKGERQSTSKEQENEK
ncbi:MAG: DUF2304 domain-containing protein [Victivallales bacterium]|nr:DUF2304 domain-containing protein [Victivallales bacterium]